MLTVSMELAPAAFFSSFFFSDTTTTEIYTLSLHDALPIYSSGAVDELIALDVDRRRVGPHRRRPETARRVGTRDRKSTRLNSSHPSISYAVFCLEKKNDDNSAEQVMFHSVARCAEVYDLMT